MAVRKCCCQLIIANILAASFSFSLHPPFSFPSSASFPSCLRLPEGEKQRRRRRGGGGRGGRRRGAADTHRNRADPRSHQRAPSQRAELAVLEFGIRHVTVEEGVPRLNRAVQGHARAPGAEQEEGSERPLRAQLGRVGLEHEAGVSTRCERRRRRVCLCTQA